MEILAIIGGLFVVWIIVALIMLRMQLSKYSNFFNLYINTIKKYDYKESELRDNRIQHISEVGLATATIELIQEVRGIAIVQLKINPNLFEHSSVKVLETNFIMSDVMVDGKAEDYQTIMSNGIEIEQMMKNI